MEIALKYLIVFLVGGTFSFIAQVVIDKTKVTPARVLVTYVCVGVFLSAIGVYTPLKEFANAGASVPLTGFGSLIAEGVRKAVDERGLIGALTGVFSLTSGGIAAAIVFGFLASLIFSSKPKR